MRIAIGADHGGFTLKSEIKDWLESHGHEPVDMGSKSADPCDYPRFAFKVAQAVSGKKADAGILICKSGNGMAMAANKVPGVRAAICYDKEVARLSREHNDANILVLGSQHVLDDPEVIIKSWLDASFEGGRHARRVNLIKAYEKKISGKS